MTTEQLNGGHMAKEFSYREQYGLVIICKDEEEQKALYEKLKRDGYKLKVVVV